MPVDPLAIWNSTWATLPLDPTGVLYPPVIGTWLATRVLGFTFDPLSLAGTPPTLLTWAKPVFEAGITGMIPDPTQVLGATTLATAWESAILASTILALPGSFVIPPTPATTFSVVTSTLIDIPSVTAAKIALISALSTALPTPGILFPVPTELRTAFLSVTYTASGLNSIVPTPTPLIVPGIAVL